MSFEYFRKVTDGEQKVARNCIKFVTEYEKDLSKHMIAEEHLYNRRRSIFRSDEWSETLYEQTEPH